MRIMIPETSSNLLTSETRDGVYETKYKMLLDALISSTELSSYNNALTFSYSYNDVLTILKYAEPVKYEQRVADLQKQKEEKQEGDSNVQRMPAAYMPFRVPEC